MSSAEFAQCAKGRKVIHYTNINIYTNKLVLLLKICIGIHKTCTYILHIF